MPEADLLHHHSTLRPATVHEDEVDDKAVPHVPMSHPFVERLISSVRRELLDQTFFWTTTDLENKLRDYQVYYNKHRCHSSRDGSTPVESRCSEVMDAAFDAAWRAVEEQTMRSVEVS